MTFKLPLKALLASAAICVALPSSAHHGSNGQFDMTSTINVSGVITKISMVNPHSYVYFDVTTESGEIQKWRCEHRSGSIMKRSGWTKDMFEVGTKIDIVGAQARREEFGCYTRSISFDGGPMIQRNATIDKEGNVEQPPRELVTEESTPNFAGNWAYIREARGGGGQQRGGQGGNQAGGQAGGMTGPDAGRGAPPQGGMAGGPPRAGGGIELTAAGQKASAGFEPDDNPRYHCKATNIFLDLWFDEHVNTVEQSPNLLKINYGFMDIDREIHIDGEFPSVITPSRAGYSIGKWDGDTLVVTTKGFLEGYLDGRGGIKHSDQFVTVERFTMSKDGKTLTQDYEGTDPLYLKGAYTGSRTLTFTTDAFDPYECEDLTQEIVDGF